jgi:hypothetical protein
MCIYCPKEWKKKKTEFRLSAMPKRPDRRANQALATEQEIHRPTLYRPRLYIFLPSPLPNTGSVSWCLVESVLHIIMSSK